MPEEQELNLDPQKLEEALSQEVAKDTGEGEETQSGTTPAETSPEDSSSTRTDTSLKTDEKIKSEEEENRFDKHPRWQQLKQQRDEALEKAREAETYRERLKGIDPDELERLSNAAQLLKKYPELADKVRKVIQEHQFDKEEVTTKIDEVLNRQKELEDRVILKEYDEKVSQLIKEHKISQKAEPLIRKILDNEVINQGITFEKLPDTFKAVLKDMDTLRRETLASHIESKGAEPKVPVSPAQRGKVMTTKTESAEREDLVSELAEGLRAARVELPKED